MALPSDETPRAAHESTRKDQCFPVRDGFGLWCEQVNTEEDGLVYQSRMRAEWEQRESQ
jgi:hypothetical protein